MIDLFIQWLIKQITNTYGNHAFFKDIRKSPHLGIEIVSYRLLQRMARIDMDENYFNCCACNNHPPNYYG